MASVSSAHLILFIASLLIAASVAGTFTQGVQRLSSALGDRSLDVSQDVRTDVEIISDPGSGAVYEDDTIRVLVKNTGSRDLPAESDQIEVLVNGEYQTDVTVSVVDGSTWQVGNVVELEIESDLDSDTDHRVKVVVNGDEEVLEFRT
ncbi:flagellar protein G [Halorussus salilacus]|uniref:CARDB domain-containing protein n=1 Tax=Halorussus salilacus TaxID=2953750 RepID=UPI00209F7C20|nr:CARDB domain-containing protein [Halorussus salilacus]USZ68125.1 flagellar protein G [Halorussus salilacus]